MRNNRGKCLFFIVIFALLLATRRIVRRKVLDDHPNNWPAYDVFEIGPPNPISLRPLANLAGALMRRNRTKTKSIFVKIGEDDARLGFARFATRWRGKIDILQSDPTCISSCVGGTSDRQGVVTYWAGSWDIIPEEMEGKDEVCSGDIVLYLTRATRGIRAVGVTSCAETDRKAARLFEVTLPESAAKRADLYAGVFSRPPREVFVKRPSSISLDQGQFELVALASNLECACLGDGALPNVSLDDPPAVAGYVAFSVDLVRRANEKHVLTFPVNKGDDRVLVIVSSGGSDNLFPLVFQARTVGKWKDPIVFLTDKSYDSTSKRESLRCLDIRVVTTPDVQLVPGGRVAYRQLLVHVMREFREYAVVEYIDIDTIITGEMKTYTPDDFEGGTYVLQEGDALVVLLSPLMPSPVELSIRFRELVSRDGPMDVGDLLRLTYDGHMRSRGEPQWRIPLEEMFQPGKVGILHEAPDAVDSPYHPLFVVIVRLASMLSCPTLTS